MTQSRHTDPSVDHRIESQRKVLLQVPFDAVTFSQAVDRLIELAQGDRPAYAVTANVDHVVRFHQCPAVRHLYTEADMVVADGMPLIWASKLLGIPLPERVAGSDLFPALCARAASSRLSVYMMGGSPGTAEKSAKILQDKCPGLIVAGTCCPDFGFEKDPSQNRQIVKAIRDARPDILFVGLGSPKQEEWIVENLTSCNARLSVGVGISFSFVCGEVIRAPRWIQRIGMEWLHRMFQEPGRLWKRYLVQDRLFFSLLFKALLRSKKQGSNRESIPIDDHE